MTLLWYSIPPHIHQPYSLIPRRKHQMWGFVPCRAAMLEPSISYDGLKKRRMMRTYFQNVGLNTIDAAETVLQCQFHLRSPKAQAPQRQTETYSRNWTG